MRKVSDTYKREFAKNLWRAMNEKGWNQATLMQRADRYTSVSRQDINKYCSGVSVPGPTKLAAIGKALGIDGRELLPAHQAANNLSPTQLFDLGDGTSRLVIDRVVPSRVAAEVVAMLNTPHSDPIFDNHGDNDDGSHDRAVRRGVQGKLENRSKMDRRR